MIKRIFMLMLLATFGLLCRAQTNNYKIHLISFYDNVTDIKDGCKEDRDNFYAFMKEVSNKLGVQLIDYNANNIFSFNKMEEIYTQMKPSSNDVIVFMYSGHGYHSPSQSESNKFPFMVFTEKNQQNKNLLRVHESLLAKNARLTMTVGDLCNSMAGAGPSDDYLTWGLEDDPLKNYVKLFAKAKGNFIMSSSDTNEPSYVRNAVGEGSHLIYAFIKTLNYVLKDHPEKTEYADWKILLEETKREVVEQTTKYAPKPQHPVYNVNISYNE